ncbi:hypothetical protein Tco_0845973 [Tanacetum coccineum]
MGTPTQLCVRSCPNISALAGRPFRCVKSKIPLRSHQSNTGANGGVEEVNGNVDGANRRAPDFSMIIAQQLQNLLHAMLA